ncbi:MAG TPA: SIS domain-containing protein [Candidatus Acidoferrum sp.]|nr:SIS domain-containing protein [Candidatus Acidoferrum sp.]
MKKKTRNVRKKKAAGLRPENLPSRVAGQHTLQEILSQPGTWLETARQFSNDVQLVKIYQSFSSQEPWLFVACGSSYYLSQTIAAQWTKLFPAPCTAVPGSEFLFAPDEILKRTAARQAVLLSRSGKTTEVLRAAELLITKNSIRTLGVTCNAHSALEELCTETLKLPWADEKSMVMTRSFTSILLLFESMGAKFAGDAGLASALDGLPEKTARWLDANVDKIRALGKKGRFADFVFLGQGAHYWLAQEAALKMTEMSSSYAQAYHTLEFRHGPKSIASRETLVTFLLSDAALEEELPLISELKKLGAATLVVANRATQELRRNSDLLIELGLDEPEYARMAMTAIPAQILGLAVGLRKRLNPDTPKNLTRAVVLGPNGKVLAKRRRN